MILYLCVSLSRYLCRFFIFLYPLFYFSTCIRTFNKITPFMSTSSLFTLVHSPLQLKKKKMCNLTLSFYGFCFFVGLFLSNRFFFTVSGLKDLSSSHSFFYYFSIEVSLFSFVFFGSVWKHGSVWWKILTPTIFCIN